MTYTQRLLTHLDTLERAAAQHERTEPTVSAATIGWHIAHTTAVIGRVIASLEQSDPTQYKWQFNRRKILVFLFNKIPRGKAKAPKAVQPTESDSTTDLMQNIERARLRLIATKEMNKKLFFEHHIFGHLSHAETLHFLNIHTQHHVNIIRDILR